MAISQAYSGGFADPAYESARAFRSIMNAMARPGTIETVDAGERPSPLSVAAGTVILTLCDPDTTVALKGKHDTSDVQEWITFHTNARFAPPQEADFIVGTWDAIVPLDTYKIGTPEYPDQSATLIIEQDELMSSGSILSGPGIKTQAHLNLPEIQAFQANNALFPLGLDFFFCAGQSLAALPRSTHCVEAA